MDSNSRLPVPVKRNLPAKRRSQYPALLEQAAPVVARGAALVAAGLIGRWLIESVARSALTSPRANGKTSRKDTALVTKRDDELPEGTIAISETTVIMRRLIVRR